MSEFIPGILYAVDTEDIVHEEPDQQAARREAKFRHPAFRGREHLIGGTAVAPVVELHPATPAESD